MEGDILTYNQKQMEANAVHQHESQCGFLEHGEVVDRTPNALFKLSNVIRKGCLWT